MKAKCMMVMKENSKGTETTLSFAVVPTQANADGKGQGVLTEIIPGRSTSTILCRPGPFTDMDMHCTQNTTLSGFSLLLQNWEVGW